MRATKIALVGQGRPQQDYIQVWRYVEQLGAKEFEELKQLSNTDSFGIVAARLNDPAALLSVYDALRRLQVPLSDREAKEGYPETQMAVAAITKRLFDWRGQ